MTRNQICKRKAEIKRRFTEIQSNPRRSQDQPIQADVNLQEFQEREKSEIESLREELRELEIKWEGSSDADEPNQEIYIPSGTLEPVPLLVLLHGAGWTGGSQIELWESIAAKEKIALLAPTSLDREWTHRDDYTALISQFNRAINTMGVDASRIYLIGHSRGGAQALRTGLVNPNHFAALALHSPSWDQGILREQFVQGSRRLRIRVWAGSDYDRDSNRHWAELLQHHFQQHAELANVDLDLKLLEGHYHSDYNTRIGLLDEMWSFLKGKSLSITQQ